MSLREVLRFGGRRGNLIRRRDMAKLKTGIMGATGYAGEELIRILLNHPNVEITSLAAKIDSPKDAGDIFPEFRNRIRLTVSDRQAEEMAKSIDLVFLALPHKVSMEVAPYFLKAKKNLSPKP